MKGKKIYSIVKGKCPVCHEGQVFENKALEISNFARMHERCDVCGHKYQIENGFWYGAMYVSYAITVALAVATFVLTYLIYPAASAGLYIGLISTVIVLCVPMTYRGSRLIWMNFFSSYDPSKSKENK